jgi:Icc-related predicted phosphoesterase
VVRCLFVSDLHGRVDRYEKLFRVTRRERPQVVLLGGDLLPSVGTAASRAYGSFIDDFFGRAVRALKDDLGPDAPTILLVLGNDDPLAQEAVLVAGADRGLWRYLHEHRLGLGGHTFFGYAHVPPSPFLQKDWERYDVSQHVDVGCVSPEQGYRSRPVSVRDLRYYTMARNIERLAAEAAQAKAVWLFHAPPYDTKLDRAALDGRRYEHVPLDVHVGSIAIRRFIRDRQPLLTLHGHVHESARLTGAWRDRIGRTHMFSAAHDGPELALVRFDLNALANATRELI